MGTKKQASKKNKSTSSYQAETAPSALDHAEGVDLDLGNEEVAEMVLKSSGSQGSASPGAAGSGGDPEAHQALVDALSEGGSVWALEIFAQATPDRRAAIARAMLEAFGAEEGATLVAEAYQGIGEEVPDLDKEPAIVEQDLEVLDEAPTEIGPSPALEEALAQWRPALEKVTDPVAFMSDSSYNDAILSGASKDTGFYQVAIAELTRLQGELDSLTLDLSVTPAEAKELCALADLVTGWAFLYETLRDTKDRRSDREGLTQEVLSVVELTQTKLNALEVGVIGLGTLARLDQSLNEVRIFLGGWATLASDDSTSAAKPMWASFL